VSEELSAFAGREGGHPCRLRVQLVLEEVEEVFLDDVA